MKTAITFKTLVVLGLMLVLSVGLVEAQRRGGGKRMPKYDPATVVTVQGTVTEIVQQRSPAGWPGTHLTLKTEDTTLDVHLGPADFVASQDFPLAKGDQIEVTGSRIKDNGTDSLIAREVKKGDNVLTLRDEQGVPKWSRARRRW